MGIGGPKTPSTVNATMFARGLALRDGSLSAIIWINDGGTGRSR